MIKLHDYVVSKTTARISEAELNFLSLSGRKAFHSQGIYGQDTIVAVVDTGVTPHQELRGKILTGKSFVTYTNRTFDDNGHGTHVAGTIAGSTVGIAPGAKILPVKVLDSEGSGSLENLVQGLEWVSRYNSRDRGRVSVVNMSLSVEDDLTEEEKTSFHNAIKALVDNDIAVIVSAGNTGKEDIRYPAAFPEVISVGAVDINQERAMFSTMGEHIDVCQIGVDVVSSWYKGGYAVMSGTSMSAPMVSGISALIASKYKETFAEVITEDYLWKSIKISTKDLGIEGADREYGTGFCTLQPLEVKMVVKNNSQILKVNEQVYKLDREINITDGSFWLPGGVMGDVTGAYVNYVDDTLKYSY
ncbi:MAG: S8 family peptidase [Peptococcaceae bacterium]